VALQEENTAAGNDADTINDVIPTKIHKAAVTAALDDLLQQQSSNESSHHDKD
jgi:hypothetical protein